MKTLRQTLERNLYGIAAAAFLLAATVPNILISSVSAAQFTDRSIQMEVATAGAEDVEYTITFTPATGEDIQGIVVDFCAESPLPGTTCTFPTGMAVGDTVVGGEVSIDGTPDTTWAAGTVTTGDALTITKGAGATFPAGDEIEVVVSGFDNPTDADTFYARIFTFTTTAGAAAYESDEVGEEDYVDFGGIALSTTDDITISAAVQETLIFCVSSDAPGAACGTDVNTPALILGQGTPETLDSSRVDDATAYFQLSSNAGGGTAVRLAGDTLKSGSNDIDPVGDTAAAIVAGTEAFGLRLGTPVDVTTENIGSIAREEPYDHATNYAFNTTNTNSPYGDVIAQASEPLADWNVPLIFAATISPATPAGMYTTSLSLIATGVY